ncbi:hypothetical protein [Paraburkholderia dinghuensis]|uniref:Uncharacterized protein n=1 Tax=Paraburkholderia dinghuensis TaxID=2305225 RepID=A0A3N6PLI9_9BURK|nr:hypothetical protein [Paraburkholderia dinghuensis]RQG99815.1 hypothetical protein D1Y85_26170 [Paraburkholderia dinghuensis]
MTQHHEPHRLVIQHMDILETAPKVVDEVERHVFSVIDEKLRQWEASRKDWEGVYNLIADETSFKPKAWENSEDGTYRAYFGLGSDSSVEHAYYLSALTGMVPAKFGIWFCVDVGWVTRLGGKGGRPGTEWKKFLAEQFRSRRLGEFGFELHGPDLLLPIRVDAQALADHYPDSLTDALAPVDEALKQLEAAAPSIQGLLDTALQYPFGNGR